MTQKNIKEYVAAEKEKLRAAAQGTKIKLGIIDGTDEADSANQLYIKNKIKDFSEMGWECQVYPVCDMFAIPELMLYQDIENPVQYAIDYAINDGCTSVIVQLPLAEKYRKHKFEVPIDYDCDGFHPLSRVNPATPQGIIDYLEACEFPFSGKTAVVIGRSNIVGKPMAKMLLNKDMTVSVCHSKSDVHIVSGLLCDADLVVVATGVPHLIVRNQCMNAIVVDVGINNVDGKLIGDFEEKPHLISENVWSTPVPGGVGLLTRLALLKNCYKLAKRD